MRLFVLEETVTQRTLTLHVPRPARGPEVRGIVEGIPAGMLIPKGYLSHQLWRIRNQVGSSGRMPKSVPVVAMLSGIARGRTTGAPIAFTISMEAFGPEASRRLDAASGFTLRGLATSITCLTLVRKFLEDRRVFIGSRVLAPSGVGPAASPSVEDPHIARWLKASCGAYKITEQADRSSGRILSVAGLPQPGRRLGGRPFAFELLVSGPSGWMHNVRPRRPEVAAQLAERLAHLAPIQSVTADESHIEGRRISLVRLRALLETRRGGGEAAPLSVVAETMIIPNLARRVAGVRIVGLPEPVALEA
jgi:hypothetical protein